MLYLYDKTTYEYKGTIEEGQYIPYCCYVTDVPPPEYGEYEIPVFIPYRNSWIILPDYRGTWYNKYNPEEKIEIHNIGERIDTTIYTDKPCPNINYYVWSEEQNDWIFDINKYKQFKISYLIQQYQNYLNARIPLIKLIGFNSLSTISKILLDSNIELTEEEYTTLAEIVDDAIKILVWVNTVTIYEDDIESKILEATTQEEIDEIVDNINFEQFDDTLPDTTIVPKLRYVQQILESK